MKHGRKSAAQNLSSPYVSAPNGETRLRLKRISRGRLPTRKGRAKRRGGEPPFFVQSQKKAGTILKVPAFCASSCRQSADSLKSKNRSFPKSSCFCSIERRKGALRPLSSLSPCASKVRRAGLPTVSARGCESSPGLSAPFQILKTKI